MYNRRECFRVNVSGFIAIGAYFVLSITLFDIGIGFLKCRTIVPYIRKFGKHPVTGAPLKGEDLIPLIFHKNSEGFFFFFPTNLILWFHCDCDEIMKHIYVSAIVGEYHCPVLNKVFTEFTHIVAVKTTGNVFCYEVCVFSVRFCF